MTAYEFNETKEVVARIYNEILPKHNAPVPSDLILSWSLKKIGIERVVNALERDDGMFFNLLYNQVILPEINLDNLLQRAKEGMIEIGVNKNGELVGWSK